MRSPATLQAYFEALYPNAVLHVRLAQNLKYLDRLIDQRLDVCTKLERCLYAEHLGAVRPTVRVGHMLNEIDAIRHYNQMLDDLNMAIEKQQKIARRLSIVPASVTSNSSNPEVIREFLKVTEIKTRSVQLSNRNGYGSLSDTTPVVAVTKQSLSVSSSSASLDNVVRLDAVAECIDDDDVSTSGQHTRSRKRSDSSLNSKTEVDRSHSDIRREVEAAVECAGGYSSLGFSRVESSKRLAIDDYNSDGDSEDEEDDDDDDEAGLLYHEKTENQRRHAKLVSTAAVSAGHPMHNCYRMTWNEWLWHLWTSRSVNDFWRALKEGRQSERHSYAPGRSAAYDTTMEDDLNEEEEDDGGSNRDASYQDNDESQQCSAPPGLNARQSLISPPEERRLFLSKAFVTFKTFAAATTARQIIHMQLAGRMSISEAPEPSDITWVNLYGTRKGSMIRRFIIESAVLLLIVVWVAPVTLLSYIFSEDALSSFSPWIKHGCETNEWFRSTVEMAQPLALVGIMNLLPPLLTVLALLQGCTSFSSNQFISFDRYFTFQIINVFLVTTIGGSVMDCVADIYSNPSAAFELLGSSLPKMGGFFTNYVLVKSFTGLGMEIVRFTTCFAKLGKYLFTYNATPRDYRSFPFFGLLRNFETPGWFPYAKIYGQDMLMFVVCATYACISPLILGAGICYYAGAAFIYKHQLLFVYEQIFETGGKWWPKMARCFVVALLFAQATMVGMMILKETYTEVYYLSFLVVGTSFYYYYVASIYEPLAHQLPLDMALSMDRERDHLGLRDETLLHTHEDYMQPSLRAGPLVPEVEFRLDDKRRPASKVENGIGDV
jgi:hypothetical protein